MKIRTLLPLLLAAGVAAFAAEASAQQVFATPDAAADALVDGANAPGSGKLQQIFGGKAADLLSTGDPDVDARNLKDFLALAARGRAVTDGPDGSKLLAFGDAGWQFPIPLKATAGGWSFDISAGEQHVADLTIGENELVAIGACADFVAAQNEYFQSLHDEEPVQQYARKFISSPGQHDGLYWPPATATDRSPLGDRVVAAASPVADPSQPRAYHGYRFKMLTRQGAAAPGGAYDYLVNGRMLAGYALLAYPAEWGETGYMTFLCDQRGQVYERNLGPDTEGVARGIASFNPGRAWTVVEP